MTEYTPDNWVVIRMTNEGKTFYKVLAGWSGGYLDGNSWRMNSGITKVEEAGDYWIFHGASGSTYRCFKEFYKLRMNNAHIWEKLSNGYPENVHMMDEATDWSKIEWGLSDA